MLIFTGSKRSLRGGPAGLFRDTDFATFKETLYCPCLDGILEKWVLKLRDEGNEMSYAYGTGIFRIFLFFIIGKDIQRCVMLGHMILVRSYKTQIRFFHGKLDPTFPSSPGTILREAVQLSLFFQRALSWEQNTQRDEERKNSGSEKSTIFHGISKGNRDLILPGGPLRVKSYPCWVPHEYKFYRLENYAKVT